MIYGDVCTGISAASVAWHPLGWRPAFFAEVAPFPSRVLRHHYPSVPNAGDFTTIQEGQYEPIDVLVGGTPCQDFSIGGLRAGMAGKRGHLTVEYARLAERLRPRWLAWENVPGVLSIDSGRAFGTFLGMLGQLGYGLAYRVLDAQHFGVAQQRERVFVVGYRGDWRCAAGALFERASLLRTSAPKRTAAVSVCITARGQGSLDDRETYLVDDRGPRRLSPLEVERCFGFPDHYTRLSPRTPNGPRYKALGNSMAVPVMRWIGERIQMVESLRKVEAA